MPRFSIITPVYNRQHMIGKAIMSVISQTYGDWEMIIVDDGSTDSTVSIIKMYEEQDKRIKLVHRHRPPKGAATCRNIGLQKATGDYVIFLDSDDQLRPFALEQRLRAFRDNPTYDFLVFQTIKKNLNEQQDHFLLFLSLRSPWQTAGPVWKLSSLVKHSLVFDEQLLIWQDVDFHLMAFYKKLSYKLMRDYPADVIYSVHTETLSQKAYDYQQRRSQIYFLLKHLRLNKQNKKAKQPLKELCDKLIQKNLQQRYLDNVLRLMWIKLFKIN